MSRKKNPHRKEITAYWISFKEPKPSIKKFAVLCKEQGWPVSEPTLRQWRNRGYLSGDMRRSEESETVSPMSVGAAVNSILRKAQADSREAANLNGIFSKTMLREVCAKTIRCAEAYITRSTEEAVKVPVKDAADLAIIANVAMTVMGKAVEVSEAMQLLMVTDKSISEADAAEGTVIDLDAMREKIARQARGE